MEVKFPRVCLWKIAICVEHQVTPRQFLDQTCLQTLKKLMLGNHGYQLKFSYCGDFFSLYGLWVRQLLQDGGGYAADHKLLLVRGVYQWIFFPHGLCLLQAESFSTIPMFMWRKQNLSQYLVFRWLATCCGQSSSICHALLFGINSSLKSKPRVSFLARIKAI